MERPAGVRLLWEPLGEWPADVVAALCDDLGLVHVVDPFVTSTVTPEQTYLRLHGIRGVRHVYADVELRQLAAMLPQEPKTPSYVLFNDLTRVGDARRFVELLGHRASPILGS